ncbi:hypothetical protein EV368DRAFT_86799 [Lentinula lateritia]|nr:hypothetical protein EV368DRAFT_86799 [Lentinula lateritia]
MSSALFTAVTTTLKGDNYDTWISEMEAFLQATGLGSAITSDPPAELSCPVPKKLPSLPPRHPRTAYQLLPTTSQITSHDGTLANLPTNANLHLKRQLRDSCMPLDNPLSI